MTDVNRFAVIAQTWVSTGSVIDSGYIAQAWFYGMDENPSAIVTDLFGDVILPPDAQRAPILKPDGRLHVSLLPLSVQALVGQGVKTVDASATSVTTTSLADVTGLSFVMEAGSTYRFEAELLVSASGLAGTVGVGTAYSGTNSAVFSNTTIGGSVTGLSSLLTAVVGSVLLNSVNPVRIAGRIRTTTAGTFSIQAQRSAGVTATLTGGCAQFSKV